MANYSYINPLAKAKGFTLMELMIVVIILGIMASIALPRLTNSQERVVKGEGIEILMSLLHAQKRYALENDGTYAAALSSLDVSIPTSNNFNPPTVAATDPIASIASKKGTYTLTMTTAGVVGCSGTLCSSIGY